MILKKLSKDFHVINNWIFGVGGKKWNPDESFSYQKIQAFLYIILRKLTHSHSQQNGYRLEEKKNIPMPRSTHLRTTIKHIYIPNKQTTTQTTQLECQWIGSGQIILFYYYILSDPIKFGSKNFNPYPT
jgi:hypothetical protein